MYWKEIPIQIQAKDKDNTKNHQLSAKFQVTIDKVAMFDGSYGADEYLDGWSYGPEINLDMNINNKSLKISSSNDSSMKAFRNEKALNDYLKILKDGQYIDSHLDLMSSLVLLIY